MRKGWLIFILVLLISVQMVVLSSFHDVEVNGVATGNSVISIAKWNYVQGVAHFSIYPVVHNGTVQAELVLPNGTRINLSSLNPLGSPYTFSLQLPRTGDFYGNSEISGPISISQSQPMSALISQNVGSAVDYVSYLRSIADSSQIPIDLYVLILYGEAQVSVQAYVVSL